MLAHRQSRTFRQALSDLKSVALVGQGAARLDDHQATTAGTLVPFPGATARHPKQVIDAFPDAGDALVALELDVTIADQARAAVGTAVEHFGRIDVLVNTAGIAGDQRPPG